MWSSCRVLLVPLTSDQHSLQSPVVISMTITALIWAKTLTGIVLLTVLWTIFNCCLKDKCKYSFVSNSFEPRTPNLMFENGNVCGTNSRDPSFTWHDASPESTMMAFQRFQPDGVSVAQICPHFIPGRTLLESRRQEQSRTNDPADAQLQRSSSTFQPLSPLAVAVMGFLVPRFFDGADALILIPTPSPTLTRGFLIYCRVKISFGLLD